MIKPLDIVRTPLGGIAMVTEYGSSGASIDYLGGGNPTGEKSAWWHGEDLTVLDSIPRLLANAMAHPFGQNKKQGDVFFGDAARQSAEGGV